MRLKIPQQTQLSSLCLSNPPRPSSSSLHRSASSAINPFGLAQPVSVGRSQGRKEGKAGSGTDALLALPRGVFCEKPSEMPGPTVIGPKITAGGFCWRCGFCLAHARPSCRSIFCCPFLWLRRSWLWGGEGGSRAAACGTHSHLGRGHFRS